MTQPVSNTSTFSTYVHPEMVFSHGEGPWLFTKDGEKYLDFGGGIAVSSLGHCHPHMVAALNEQSQKLWHISNLYQIEGQERLADRLVDYTFADKVFFTNSGAEANECAIKTARHYHFANGHPDKYEIITFEGAFHGRTTATIAAGGQQKYYEGFGPKAPGFVQVPAHDMDALKSVLSHERTAAIMIEPIQGEGGIHEIDVGFIRQLRTLCDEYDALLIFDEIQTGVGRTSKFFAHEWSGVAPDIMAIAKGIGGGFPFGACLATTKAAESMTPGTHGTTFGGNPLAMAVGNAVLDVVLEDGFFDHVSTISKLIEQRFAQLIDQFPDLIENIRGRGLMIGIKCKVLNTDLVRAMMDEKLLGVPAGDNVVRLLPPLTLSETEARDGLDRLERALQHLSQTS